MAEIKVIMPQMGESIVEGTITKWLKKVGESVERDEPLFEISTDKIDSEIPAPASGILKRILVEEDIVIEINTVVAVIDSSDEASEGSDSPGDTVGDAAVDDAPARSPGRSGSRDPVVPASPMVRRLAQEHGVDLAALEGKGTGAGGRITKRDIMSYIEQKVEEACSTADPEDDDERVPMSLMRKSIADHMINSRRTSAHVATVFEVDCSQIMAARASLKANFERSGVKLTYTPFFVHVVAQALKQFPILNSSVDGGDIVQRSHINVGVAVALDDGLLVPVIRNADEANLLDLARTISDLGGRARTKTLQPEEVQGGTFTITNPGIFGGLYGIPIINQPQVAILAIGGIEKRPVVVDDAISIRPMAYLALSFDHRIIDGAVADQFMSEVKDRLQNWKA
jgi:pyruvate dehydrogenase E2 component (dihydrolipoamide acetyltransferase)